MTVGDLYHFVKDNLSQKFSQGEAKEMTLLVFEQLINMSMTDVLVRQESQVSDFIVSQASKIIQRTISGEPLQYVLGTAHFYGMKFKVTPATLIPRHETSELVDLIVNDWRDRSDLRVLDLGTGSGCIAVSLARNLRFPEITAIDISDEALDVAVENARNLKAKVTFCKEDILALPVPENNFDIIVSNPPYITLAEAQDMDVNVLEHEPATALFVPDNNPLKFYLPIADYAVDYLNPDGKLYFEINPIFASRLKEELMTRGFISVDIVKDISRKNRFIVAHK